MQIATRQQLLRDDELTEEETIRLARTSIRAFFEYVMRDEESGARVQMEPFQEEWHDLLDRYDRLILWSFAESGKSVNVSVARTLWELGRDSSLRFAIVSQSSERAVKNANQISRYILDSDELHKVFPNLVPDPRYPWNSEQITVKRSVLSKDPSVNTLGEGTNTQGARIDRLILDDILTHDNTHSAHMRTGTLQRYLKTFPGRMTARGRIAGIGNALHPDDLFHTLAKNPRFKAYKYPIVRRDGSSVWPQAWPLARIEARKMELGPLETMIQLMCQAVDDATARFKREWIEKCKTRGEGKTTIYAIREIPPGCKVYIGVDLAVGRKQKNDRTVYFVLLIHPNGDRQPLWIEAGRFLADEIMDRVVDLHQRFHGIFVVENVAAQDYLVQLLNKWTSIPIIPFTTGKNKADPSFGVEAMAVEFANGKWIIPNDGGKCDPELKVWIDEILGYQPDAHTGDSLMSCLAPGAMVTTAKGLIPIEHIREGDLVLTHRGRWRTVTGTTVHHHLGDVIHIKPSGLMPLLATPNHPVWKAAARFERKYRTNRLQPNQWEWARSDALRSGRKQRGDYVFSPTPESWPHYAPTRVDLAAFIVERKQKWGGRWHVAENELRWAQTTVQSRWLTIDEEAAVLIGLYLAKGNLGGNKTQAVFSFHRRELHLRSFVHEQALRLFSANTSREVVHNAIAARFLAQLGTMERKAMPWPWMAWPLALRVAVVRGWFMGDGTQSGGNLAGVSIAANWIEQARITLAESGLCPQVGVFLKAGPRSFQGKPSTCRTSWRLALSASDSARLLSNPLPVEQSHWANLPWPTRERTNSGALPWDGGLAVRLTDVHTVAYEGPVYNLHVEDDESYVANGTAVHNSWFAKEGERLGHLAPVPMTGVLPLKLSKW